MHRLSHITIKNFRACRNVSLPLEGYTPLVGPNNTGKSTILQAISWVLKPSALALQDFFDRDQPVEVIACIDGISDEILERVPDSKHRSAIIPYCRGGRLWIRVTAISPKSIKKEVWDVEQCSQNSEPSCWREYPTGLPQAVSVLLPDPVLVQAMHDIGEDLGKAKAGTTIKELLDEIMGPLLAAHGELNSALDTIRHILTAGGENRSEYLHQFDADATDALKHFFPGLALDLDLQAVEVKELFKAGDLHVTDTSTGDRRRFDQMGTGAQRAIQMALIRYLAEIRNSEYRGTSRRLLLIDEPELYLYPQAVRRLRQALGTLARAGFQVVFSTHSPLMLSRDNAADTVVVGKHADEGVTTRKPLRHALNEAFNGAESQSNALFELNNLVDIYFADRVVICEGKTDRRLLPCAYECLYGHSPEMDHIAFVSLDSCADIPKALPVLSAMGISVCAVADLDFAYTHARRGGMLGKDALDMDETKRVLIRLQAKHGFTLNDNGLPQNEKKNGWSASDVWSCFAEDQEGQLIAEQSHEALKKAGVWIWKNGCIEDVIGILDKGESAIIEQELRLRGLSADEIEQNMPSLKACFEWIVSV
jgi:putative ATP-dependent endonuclease of the OLD family